MGQVMHPRVFKSAVISAAAGLGCITWYGSLGHLAACTELTAGCSGKDLHYLP